MKINDSPFSFASRTIGKSFNKKNCYWCVRENTCTESLNNLRLNFTITRFKPNSRTIYVKQFIHNLIMWIIFPLH